MFVQNGFNLGMNKEKIWKPLRKILCHVLGYGFVQTFAKLLPKRCSLQQERLFSTVWNVTRGFSSNTLVAGEVTPADTCLATYQVESQGEGG